LDDDASAAHPDDPHGWSAFDATGLAACVLNADLRYRRVNAAWRAYLQGDTFRFEQQPVNLNDRTLLADLPEERRGRWASALTAILNRQSGHFLDQATESSTLGDRRVVMTANPLLSDAGKIDGILCVRYDLTDAQQATANEDRLVQVL
jgi:PAS domain-containing protein